MLWNGSMDGWDQDTQSCGHRSAWSWISTSSKMRSIENQKGSNRRLRYRLLNSLLAIGSTLARGLIAGAIVLVLTQVSATPVRATAAASPSEPVEIEIAAPSKYWSGDGYVALVPAIRVSVTPGSRTVIYLRIPVGQKIASQFLPDQKRYTLKLPPGSTADRVSYSMRSNGTFAIDDVRGTRWDESGTEFFHVYRPVSDEADAPLIGFEWRRSNPQQEARATARLVDLIQSTSERFPVLRASRRDVARFRDLNRCQMCHLPNKREAQTNDDVLPPWQTDVLGLYVPLATLKDEAPLSTTAYFDDPNADDPFVSATCAEGYADRRRSIASRWFTCDDGSVPMGHYDLIGALAADQEHAHLVCATRRYLYDRLDELGRRIFAHSVQACGPA